MASAVDLTVQNLRIEQASVAAGGSVTVAWTDVNLGVATTANSWSDRLVVRNLDTGELLLNLALPYDIALVGNGPLAAGASLARSHSFPLPEGVRGSGRLQIQLFADQNLAGQGSFAEYTAAGANAENNNSASIEVVAAARSYVDLRTIAFDAPLTGRGGEPISLSWSVRNDGGIGADGGWVDRVVLSRDDTIGNADDVVLGELQRTQPLAPGAVYDAVLSLNLPLQLDGDFRLAVVADAAQQLLEPDTRTDNVSALRTLALQAPGADLRVEVVDAPAAARGGEAVTLTWRVRNEGDAVTNVDSWRDAIYLSADDVLDASDSLLAEVVRQGALAVGASYTRSASVFAPNGLTGSYRFIVRTDSGNLVFEPGADANNDRAALAATALSPAPVADLQVVAVQLPAGGVPGEARTVSWTVRNTGDAAAAGTWTDRVYLTSSGTLAGAVQIASVTQGRNLASGASYEQSASFVLPALADGEYQLLVITDVLGQVYEFPNDNNNSALADGRVQIVHPDLRVDAVRVAPTAQSAATVQVAWDVSNAGSSTLTGQWLDRVYLSRDGAVGAGDLLVATVDAGRTLAPGAGYTATASFVLPVDASGDYQLIVVSDAANQVAELNAEGNNQGQAGLAVDLAPYADLRVASIVAPDRTIDDPALVTVQWTVQNRGNGAGLGSRWTDAIVASRDGVFGNGDDVVLARFQHDGVLDAGESYTRTETFYLPAAFEGRFTLFVRTDADGEVFENGLKDDNTLAKAAPFDVMRIPYADLVIDALSPQGGAMSGRPLNVEWVVRNQGIGLTSTDNWTDVLSLSPNADGSGAVLLGRFNHLGFLEPDGSYSRTGSVLLPNGVSGTQYLVLQTGGPFEFIHTGNNRVVSAPFEIALAPAPDLVVSGIDAPQVAPEGSAIDVTWTVANQGQADAVGTWTDTVILRQFGDTGPGVTIGSFQFQGPLQAGKSYTRREQIVLPAFTSERYEVIVVTDNANVVYEGAGDSAAETNNRSVDDQQISVSVLPRPDLQVFSVTGPDSVDAGATMSVSYQIINQGPVATTVPF